MLLIVSILAVLGCASSLGLAFMWWRANRKRATLEGFMTGLLRAQEAEKTRIAAEIHNGLGQNLLIIISRAGLGINAPGNPSAMSEQLREISKVCRVAIEEARQIAHNLGPSHLQTTGLTAALEAMIERLANSTRIHFKHSIEPVDEIFSSDSAVSVYRIAQEALNNILKHAEASSVVITVICDIGEVKLSIKDDGKGLPRNEKGIGAQHVRRGFGLAEIAERVRLLGGKLHLSSEAGKGTCLTVTVPLRDGCKV